MRVECCDVANGSPHLELDDGNDGSSSLRQAVPDYSLSSLHLRRISSESPSNSRKADELGIPGPAVGTDTVGAEALLHVDPSGLVEAQTPFLHDLEDLGFRDIVKAGAGVARVDVGAEVECIAREPCLDVAGKAVRQPRVEVGGAWEVGEEIQPRVPCQVEHCAEHEDRERQAVEEIIHGVVASEFTLEGCVADRRMNSVAYKDV